jgi:hypothetical protein
VARVRDFNPMVLESFSSEHLQVPYDSDRGLRGKSWQFVILLPRGIAGRRNFQPICTGHDEDLLCRTLANHFGGYTVDMEPVTGFGLRDGQPELNLHRRITVVGACSAETELYFELLCKEIEASSGEEQIFIVRQEISIV